MGRPRARLGRLPAALGDGLRGSVRLPHDDPGRLLRVRRRLQPGLPELAALPAADGLLRPGDREADPRVLGRAAAAATRRAIPIWDGAAVPAGRSGDLQRPRLLAAAGGGGVRARDPRHRVLRQAAALLRHPGAGQGDDLGAPEGRVRPHPGRPRTARGLPGGLHRRLERLLDRVRAAHRVDAGDCPARVCVPEAGRRRGHAR